MNSSKLGKILLEEDLEVEDKVSLGLKDFMTSSEVVLVKDVLGNKIHSVIYLKNSRNSLDKVVQEARLEAREERSNKRRGRILL
jgi:hypothetical protein